MRSGEFENEPNILKIQIGDFSFLALTPISRAPEIEAGVRGVQVDGNTVRLCNCRYL